MFATRLVNPVVRRQLNNTIANYWCKNNIDKPTPNVILNDIKNVENILNKYKDNYVSDFTLNSSMFKSDIQSVSSHIQLIKEQLNKLK